MNKIKTVPLLMLFIVLLSGCQTSAASTYTDLLDQKEESQKFHYQLAIDVETPDDVDSASSPIISNIAGFMEDLDLGYEVKGDKEGERFLINQDVPRSGFAQMAPQPMYVYDALVKDNSFYVKTEDVINFENKLGTYGFTLQMTSEVEDTYIALPLADPPYNPGDVLFTNEEYEEAIKGADIQKEGDTYKFTVKGDQADNYFKELIKRSATQSFPGTVQLLEEDMEKQVKIGKVQVEAKEKDGVLKEEKYTIPFTENERSWKITILLQYFDMNYTGDIKDVDDLHVISDQEYEGYIVSEQQRDINEMLNSLD